MIVRGKDMTDIDVLILNISLKSSSFLRLNKLEIREPPQTTI